MKLMSLNDYREARALLALLLSITGGVMAISGCGQKSETGAADGKEKALGTDVEAAERPYFDAARPFAEAVAARDYFKAYEYLSTHARARMSPNQFVAPADDDAQKRNDASAVSNANPDQFARMMSATEAEYGKPTKLVDLSVFSTSPVALSGRGTSLEDKMESMFAIGLMPASIPVDIRKASLRSRLAVELSPEKLAESAKAEQTTPEKLKADPDFQPYLTLKMVLVEESGAFRVGYFEFLPPGIWD